MERRPGTPPHSRLWRDPLVISAIEVAEEVHYGQRRIQSGNPFIEHPIAVAELVASWTSDPEVIAAACLHDALEKTQLDASKMGDRFGASVVEIVASATEDPTISSYMERKRELRKRVIAAGRPATVIYSADRVSNLNDWNNLGFGERESVAAELGCSFSERLRLWREDLDELSTADPDLPFLGEIATELDCLVSGEVEQKIA